MPETTASTPSTPSAGPDQPLHMAVHSLPALGQGQLSQQRGRWKMLALLLVCAAPVVASYFTYFVVRPDGRRNFGELITPQRSMPDLAALTLEGQASNLRQLKGQWLLVSVGAGACNEACQRQLYLQRQMREALGKDKDRLDWVWLIPDAATPSEALRPALAGATVLRVEPAALADWLAPAAGRGLPDHLYVVDPMGNWMMRFPPELDLARASKAKKDLSQLLRASAFWDRAGREVNP